MALFAIATDAWASGSGASAPYLALIGPSPLRFEEIRARSTNEVSVVVADQFAPNRDPVNPATTTITSPTPVEPIPVEPAPSPVPAKTEPTALESTEGGTMTASENPEVVAISAAAPTAASEMLITSQMLAEFLKPLAGRTNGPGVTVFVPVPLNFTPPTPGDARASRATYKAP